MVPIDQQKLKPIAIGRDSRGPYGLMWRTVLRILRLDSNGMWREEEVLSENEAKRLLEQSLIIRRDKSVFPYVSEELRKEIIESEVPWVCPTKIGRCPLSLGWAGGEIQNREAPCCSSQCIEWIKRNLLGEGFRW